LSNGRALVARQVHAEVEHDDGGPQESRLLDSLDAADHGRHLAEAPVPGQHRGEEHADELVVIRDQHGRPRIRMRHERQ
jgi:hypothetical protein